MPMRRFLSRSLGVPVAALVALAGMAASPQPALAKDGPPPYTSPYPRHTSVGDYPAPPSMVYFPAAKPMGYYTAQVRINGTTCTNPALRTDIVARAGENGDDWQRVRFSVDRSLKPLVQALVDATETRFGYNIREWTVTGGFAGRTMNGSGGRIASAHCYGRAVDLNPSKNPHHWPGHKDPSKRTFVSDLPPEVVEMWTVAGFMWGGYFNHFDKGRGWDTMHFEFNGRPGQEAMYLKRLQDWLAKKPANPGNPSKPATTAKPGNPGAPAPAGSCKSTNMKPYPTISATLRNVPATKIAQCLLNRSGAGLNVDGIFGAKTRQAVMNFQGKKGLPQTGSVDPRTWTALLSQGSTPTLKPNMKNADVIRLQQSLRASGDRQIVVTGLFDAQTTAAVKRYQTSRKLGVDGIVGAQTWGALQAAKPAK